MTKTEILTLLKNALKEYRNQNFEEYNSRRKAAGDAIIRLGSPSELQGELLLIDSLPVISNPEQLILCCRKALSMLGGRSRVIPEGTPLLPDKYDPFGAFWTEKGRAAETAPVLAEAENLWQQLTGGGQGTAALYKARLAFNRGQLPESRVLAEEAFRLAMKYNQPINGICAAEILILLTRHGLYSVHADGALEYLRRICEEGNERFIVQAGQITRNNICLSLGILSEVPDWIRDGDFGAASCPQPPGWYMLEDKLSSPLLPCAMLSRMQYLTYAGRYIEALTLADTAQICFRIRFPVTDLYFHYWRALCYEALGDAARFRENARALLSDCAADGLWLIPGEYEPMLPLLEELAAKDYGMETAKRLHQTGKGMRDRIISLRDAYLQAGLPESLTRREHEILELISSGLTNAQTAKKLGIGEETVKSHLKHAYEKLGVSRRTQIARALARTRSAVIATWAR